MYVQYKVIITKYLYNKNNKKIKILYLDGFKFTIFTILNYITYKSIKSMALLN